MRGLLDYIDNKIEFNADTTSKVGVIDIDKFTVDIDYCGEIIHTYIGESAVWQIHKDKNGATKYKRKLELMEL